MLLTIVGHRAASHILYHLKANVQLCYLSCSAAASAAASDEVFNQTCGHSCLLGSCLSSHFKRSLQSDLWLATARMPSQQDTAPRSRQQRQQQQKWYETVVSYRGSSMKIMGACAVFVVSYRGTGSSMKIMGAYAVFDSACALAIMLATGAGST